MIATLGEGAGAAVDVATTGGGVEVAGVVVGGGHLLAVG